MQEGGHKDLLLPTPHVGPPSVGKDSCSKQDSCSKIGSCDHIHLTCDDDDGNYEEQVSALAKGRKTLN